MRYRYCRAFVAVLLIALGGFAALAHFAALLTVALAAAERK